MSGKPFREMRDEVRHQWMAARVTHGEYMNDKESAEHYIWRTMLRRKAHRDGHYYKNVRVCKRWLKFENFLFDMGRRPTPKHSIERKNNKGHYTPSNCYWATASEQQRNTRRNKWYKRGSRVGILSDWAEWLGISKELAHWRMKTWGTFERGKTWQRLKAR